MNLFYRKQSYGRYYYMQSILLIYWIMFLKNTADIETVLINPMGLMGLGLAYPVYVTEN